MPTDYLSPALVAALVALLHVILVAGFLQTCPRPRPPGGGAYLAGLALQVVMLLLLMRVIAAEQPALSVWVTPAHAGMFASLAAVTIGTARLLEQTIPWRTLAAIAAAALVIHLLWLTGRWGADGYVGMGVRPLVTAALHTTIATLAWRANLGQSALWFRLPALAFSVLACNELFRSVRWAMLGGLEGGHNDPFLHASFAITAIATTPLAAFSFLVLVSLRQITHSQATERQLQQARLELAKRRHAREREHLLRDLHDGVAGTLANIALHCGLLARDLDETRRRQTLQLVDSLARQGNREIRSIMNRLDHDQLPWHEFFRELRDHAETTLTPAGIQLEWHQPRPVLDEPTCPVAPAFNLMRAIKEAIQNAARHSQGDKARIEFEFEPGRFKATVIDNGRGLAHLDKTGRGLANMLRRARDLGGSAHFIDNPGKGLAVAFDVPLPLEFAHRDQPA